MKQNTVNGWSNYETWNFNLWYGDTIKEMINEYKEELETNEDTLEYGQAYHIVEGFIDQILENEETSQTGFLSDVISHAIQMIDIHELTEHYLHD